MEVVQCALQTLVVHSTCIALLSTRHFLEMTFTKDDTPKCSGHILKKERSLKTQPTHIPWFKLVTKGGQSLTSVLGKHTKYILPSQNHHNLNIQKAKLFKFLAQHKLPIALNITTVRFISILINGQRTLGVNSCLNVTLTYGISMC